MYQLTKGNIIEADTEVLINPCNCKGIAGKGLSLDFKKTFPDNYIAYKNWCESGFLKPGKLFPFVQQRGTLGPITIVNFATKYHWRNDSRIEWIKSGLEDLKHLLVDLGYKSCSIPKLGCGIGILSWNEVKPLVLHMCESLPEIEFHIYE